MTRALFAATAAFALLAACQQPAENQADSVAANNATAPPEQPAAAAMTAMPSEPLAREAALKLMHDRHENYEEMGDAMKLVSRELKSESPDLAKVREASATFTRFAPQIPSWFPPGTSPDVGKTEAKAEIWQKPEDFAAKAKGLNDAAIAFQAAAQGSDLAAIRAAHANLGKSCKACHDLYREEDH